MKETLGNRIFALRKQKGLTQNELAAMLDVSFQAISKWETDVSMPDIAMLPLIAGALDTSIDHLLGYSVEKRRITEYENLYKSETYYWGVRPSNMCYEVMRRCPPVRPLRLLDVGCGEGKDAVFFARNGYLVTALDIAASGIEKGRRLAAGLGVNVNFICADLLTFRLEHDFDIIFSSGVFHYIPPTRRREILDDYKAHTNPGGLHALNVFVDKPFIPPAPDDEAAGKGWLSGELMTHYTDWRIEDCREVIFDCQSGGVPHQHCMDIVYATKV